MHIHGHRSDLHDRNRRVRLSGMAGAILHLVLAAGLLLAAPDGRAQTYPGALSNTATVTAPGTATDPDPSDNGATDTNTLAASADLGLAKTLLSASPAAAGSTVQYQVVVGNDGPSAAIGATIDDTVPAELTNVAWTCSASAGSACGTASGSGNAISLQADIAPGGSVILAISGTAPASGTIGANTAVATVPPGTDDPDPGDNTDTVPPVPVTGVADLGITKTLLTASPAPAGSTVTYRLDVINAGPSVATGATITDIVPSQLTGVSWSCVAAGASSCGTASGTGDVNLQATVAAGPANGVAVTVTGTAPAGGSIDANTASVAAPPGTDDPDPGDNADTEPPVPVAPIVSIDSASGAEGTDVVFTVSLSGASATDVTVTLDTADGTATSPADYTAQSGLLVTVPAGSTSVPVAVPTVGDALYEGDETFTATLTNPVGASLGTATGTGTIVDDDLNPVQLRLVKRVSRREARPGDLVRYTVTVENVGDVDAVGVALVDTPPSGFSYVEGSLRVEDGDDSALLAGTNPIRIEGIDVAEGATATVSYYLRIGAGVAVGSHVNHVIARDERQEPISNEASAGIRVVGDPLFDESLVLGSVFDDRNGNGIQDAGERGVPGVRIASVEGLVMETDPHGRYHLVGIEPGNAARGSNFILKVDPATLPPGTVFTTPNPQVRRITAGMPVRFDFGVKLPEGRLGGGQSSMVIALGEVLFQPGSADLDPKYAHAIEGIAATVREHRGGRLTITATGDSEPLAFRRAQAVQEALFKQLDPPVRERTSVDVVSRIEREQLLLALGDSVKLGNLLFDTDSATIRPRYGALIREIADAVERQHCGTLEVDGHADRRGSDAYNMNLAMRRAKAVSDAVSALLSPEAKARLRVKAVDPVRVAGADPR